MKTHGPYTEDIIASKRKIRTICESKKFNKIQSYLLDII
jgi:hypothetical protein